MHENPSPGSWRPLLEGALRERALEVVEEIAGELSMETAAPRDSPPFSLARGAAGQSLLFLYLDQASPRRDHDGTAVDLLELAIEGLRDPAVPPGLYSGFSGVAWAVEHVQRRLAPDDEDLGEEIASALQELLSQTPWRWDYDLISGLVGYGVYALERLPRPGAEECLDLVLARLAENAVRHGTGITWFTPSELLSPKALEICPGGYYNLGVSHGVPGVIGLLGEIHAAGLGGAGVRELLDGAMAWLLEQKLPPGSLSVFPYHVAPAAPAAPDAEPRSSRLAWCYGDLGIAAALLGTARRRSEPRWEREALDLGRHAAAWPLDKAGIRDAGLCHGAAGVAHLFNRLYQASGDPLLAEAARGWFERVLAMRRPGEGIAGFLSWDAGKGEELGWQRDPGFLLGAAGIGLALLAAATPVEPAWDRVLLASVPPGPGWCAV